MNAVEFVKKYGIEEAKKTLSKVKIGEMSLFHKGLLFLVNSFELVMEHGSIEFAKKYAGSPYTAPEIKDVLLKAIEMVEKCQ